MWRLARAVGLVSAVSLVVPGFSRAVTIAAAAVVPVRDSGSASAQREDLRLQDLDDRRVDPFDAPRDVKLLVFVFTTTDCPIANRYAPEITRLHDTFASAGVLFRLIYPNPADSAPLIREHLRAYRYPLQGLRDPGHALVRRARATVTPEAAVFDRAGRLLYRGRIDDRYVELGVDRQVPTRRDLENALTAALAGRPAPEPVTQAVGCLLADMRP